MVRARRRCSAPRSGVAFACALAALALLTVTAAPAGSEANADGDGDAARAPLVFGQSAALSGPACALGLGMHFGLHAAFFEVNAAGGVNGRPLELRPLDDAYEPEQAVINTRRLIEEEGVFAIIGAVGTPTSNAASPVAAAAGVPYIAPFTGAQFLRAPELRSVVNLRASYYQEAEEMVERLTRDRGITRIGLLYQDDSFGLAVRRGVLRALEARELSLVSEGAYPRNSIAVKTALVDIRVKRPQAVVLAGPYAPVATFIQWARRFGFNPVFIATSFVGSRPLAEALGAQGRGVFVTQVVPFPRDTAVPVVAAYQNALRAAPPLSSEYKCANFSARQPDFISLEGYLAGRLTIHALRNMTETAGAVETEEAADTSDEPNDWTREGFLESLRSAGNIDLGGVTLNYGFDDNQGSDKVYLTTIGADGRYQPVEDLKRRRR